MYNAYSARCRIVEHKPKDHERIALVCARRILIFVVFMISVVLSRELHNLIFISSGHRWTIHRKTYTVNWRMAQAAKSVRRTCEKNDKRTDVFVLRNYKTHPDPFSVFASPKWGRRTNAWWISKMGDYLHVPCPMAAPLLRATLPFTQFSRSNHWAQVVKNKLQNLSKMGQRG